MMDHVAQKKVTIHLHSWENNICQSLDLDRNELIWIHMNFRLIIVFLMMLFTQTFISLLMHFMWWYVNIIHKCFSSMRQYMRLFSMFTFKTNLRWIYYSDSASKALYRMTFEGKANQVVTKLTSQVIGILIGMSLLECILN